LKCTWEIENKVEVGVISVLKGAVNGGTPSPYSNKNSFKWDK
jgi:hypothetical protein